jgi:DNA primase
MAGRVIVIANTLIDEIRNKTDIVAVISEFVKLRKTGKNYIGSCPFHSEKNPSFTVSQEKQIFHCFGCGEGGNVFSFLMKAENISFSEAVSELGSRAGIAVEKAAATGISKSEKDKLYEITELAAAFFTKALVSEAGAPARGYLQQRKINDSTAATFKLGYAPEGWDHLFRHLISRGAAPALIEKAGLTLPRENKDGYYDRFRNRLIFPVFDSRGRTIAFSGRSLKDEDPKYLNSPDTPIYRKGESIFGLSQTKNEIKAAKKVVLMEGNLDLLTSYQAGVKNVAAPLGTALTVNQCKLLSRLAETVVLAFDADPAGIAAAERSIELLRGQGLKVKVAELKGGKDPDEIINQAGASALIQMLDSALPFLEFKIRRVLLHHDLSDIESRAHALREIIEILKSESDDFVQKEYAKTAATALKVEPESILSEIKRMRFYRREPNRDMRRNTEKPNSKIKEAEKMLIALALQKKEFFDQLKAELRAEDFILPETRSLARALFNPGLETADNREHFVLENLEGESDRNFLTDILINENPEDPATIFADCLQVIKRENVKSKIEAIKLELGEAEKAGETEKASRLLAELKAEIY